MAQRSVFEKIHVDERDKADLGGVLEQFNLPPHVIEFVRKYQKIILAVIILVAIVIVAWSLYGSYAKKKTAESTSALSVALQSEKQDLATELSKVTGEFSGTDAALWARIKLAQHYLDDGKSKEALDEYTAAAEKVSKKDSLYPLIMFGLAQSEEMAGNLDAARSDYKILQEIKGYEGIGYFGTSRIFETEKKYPEAAAELEKYKGIIMGDSSQAQQKAYIETKITQIKAMQ